MQYKMLHNLQIYLEQWLINEEKVGVNKVSHSIKE